MLRGNVASSRDRGRPRRFLLCAGRDAVLSRLAFFRFPELAQGDGTPWPEFGEKETSNQRWRDGAFPATYPDARIVGRASDISGETTQVESVTMQLGIDRRCWENLVAIGTDAIGGALGGGESEEDYDTLDAARGGGEGGGDTDVVVSLSGYADGGGEGGGSSDVVVTFNADATGGGEGGVSSNVAASYTEAATGGGEGGGSSDVVVTFTTDAQGGGEGGKLTVSTCAHFATFATGGGKGGKLSNSTKTP